MHSQDSVAARIIETTGQLIRRRGVRHVTVDDIAGNLHISKKTIYRFFPDKDTLLKSALRAIVDPAVADLNQVFGDDLSFRESLAALDDVGARVAAQLAPPVMRDILQQPGLRAHLEVPLPTILLWCRELIRRGQADGDIRADVNPALLADLMAEVLHSVATPRFLARHNVSVFEFVRISMGALFNGVTTDRGKEWIRHV